MKNYIKLPVALVIAFLLGSSVANAVEVTLDDGTTIDLDPEVVQECAEESLNLGACACVVNIMMEEENMTSLSLDQMIELATEYPDAYQEAKADCQEVN